MIGRFALFLCLAALAGCSARTPACRLAADATRGQLLAKRCAACHDIDIRRPDHPSGGPNLHDIFMAKAGGQSLRYGYQYRPPLVAARNAGVLWTEGNLDNYLKSPAAFLRSATKTSFLDGDYMPYLIPGGDERQIRTRADIIAFFRAIKGRPCGCVGPIAGDNSCSRPP